MQRAVQSKDGQLPGDGRSLIDHGTHTSTAWAHRLHTEHLRGHRSRWPPWSRRSQHWQAGTGPVRLQLRVPQEAGSGKLTVGTSPIPESRRLVVEILKRSREFFTLFSRDPQG